MNPINVNGLEIGRVPRVVGTIASRDCLEEFGSHCKDLCDIAEVRLDEIGLYKGWDSACRRIEEAGIPVMVTLRSTEDGGKCSRGELERVEILTAALQCASIVDVEHHSNLASTIKPRVDALGKALVVSYHDFHGTPSRETLNDIITSAEQDASIVKIATMVTGDADVKSLQAILSNITDTPLCLIGMGSKGTHTRTSFPCLGSCLTYGYLDFPSAPGQLAARQLVNHLRSVHSAYNEEFIIRHELMECV